MATDVKGAHSPWAKLLYDTAQSRGFRLFRRLGYRLFGVQCDRCHNLTYEACKRCWDD